MVRPGGRELLRAHGVALVIGDRPERPFQAHWITADWTLVRFHHGWRGRRGNYSEAELAVGRADRAVVRSTVDVYAYFNNDWEVFAPRNALRLGAARLDPGSAPGPMRLTAPAPMFPTARRPPAPHALRPSPGDRACGQKGSEAAAGPFRRPEKS